MTKRVITLKDLHTDESGRPLVGTPLGRKQTVLVGIIAKEDYKKCVLIGWEGRFNEYPVVEYADGVREVLHGLNETNWL
jgi:hypothetical protein